MVLSDTLFLYILYFYVTQLWISIRDVLAHDLDITNIFLYTRMEI